MPRVTAALAAHPCFGVAPAGKYGRLHLPVAPACNIQCAFCDRRYDCVNESRPGVTSEVLTVEEAVERARAVIADAPGIRVVGVAGPGDALANGETFELFERLHGEFPGQILCASTNGLLLPRAARRLAACGVSTLTVTVNAARVETAMRIYSHIGGPGEGLPPEAGCRLLLENQLAGMEACAGLGIAVKVNTVLIPGVNDGEICAIAENARRAGASVMNVMPLIPCGGMSDRKAADCAQVERARAEAEKYLPQFRHCRQCRADACGPV